MDAASEVEPSARPARRRGATLWTFAAVAVLTLGVELALVERKWAIFGGGFGQSRTIDTPLEVLAFGAALAACHLGLLTLIFRLLRRLRGRRGVTALMLFDFAYVAPLLLFGLLAAKLQLFSYFSDSVSFQVIRNLGGGSLADAFLFAVSEGSLALIVAAGAALAYVALRLAWQRFGNPGAPIHVPRAFTGAKPFVAFLLLPLLIGAAGRMPDVRYALGCFTAPSLFTTALDVATDFDRDGYSLFSVPRDTHPFDAARHPLALDVPGNGIDEDGFGGDFAFAPSPTEPPVVLLTDKRRNLVLIVLESTRGDTIGKRIDGRLVAPNLTALASRGSYFPEAYSHVGFTTASLKSLFTGTLDPADDRASLFSDLKRNGYRVGVFSGQSESFGDIAQVVGMRRHADVFVDADTLKEKRAFSFAAQGSLLIDGGVMLGEFERRFGMARDWEQPNFLYINLQEAHFPYYHPGMPQIVAGNPIPRGDINLANREWVERTYWNAVASSDRLVGQLIARLKALGQYEDSLVVVVADHGESLFDDGFLGHGHMLNRQQTHIPLIVNQPGLGRPGPVGLTDVRGIILGALGSPRPPRTQPLFQYIGSIDRPAAIGMVTGNGAMTALRPDSGEASFGDTGWKGSIAEARDPAARARLRALTDEWARQRWLQHLAGTR